MKKLLHIVLLLAVLAVSCHKGPERIPRGDMEDIMYEVLMQDQYLKQHQELRKQADTSLVYEGVFEKYGYDTDDFLYSLAYYLEDPARMDKVMQKVEKRLNREGQVVGEEAQFEAWRDRFMRLYEMTGTHVVYMPLVRSHRENQYLDFQRDSLVYVRPQKDVKP